MSSLPQINAREVRSYGAMGESVGDGVRVHPAVAAGDERDPRSAQAERVAELGRLLLAGGRLAADSPQSTADLVGQLVEADLAGVGGAQVEQDGFVAEEGEGR